MAKDLTRQCSKALASEFSFNDIRKLRPNEREKFDNFRQTSPVAKLSLMLPLLAVVHVMAQFIKFQIFYEPRLDSCIMFNGVAGCETKVGQREPN